MAYVIDIADAVAEELAGGFFTQAFTPERKVLPAHELADLKNLRVTVVPKALEIESASRAASRFDVQVDVGIQKRIVSDMDAEVAELLGLVEEIAEFLRKRPLTGVPNATWVATANEPVYAPEHLLQHRTFTSVLTLTYRAMG